MVAEDHIDQTPRFPGQFHVKSIMINDDFQT